MAVSPADRRSSRLLFGSYVFVVASFLAAVVYTQRHVQSIDVASDQIAFDAMPTVKHLGDARQAVGQLEVALLEHVGGAAPLDESARAAIEGPLRELTAQVDLYLGLPLFPGERRLWEEVQRSTHAPGPV